MSHWILSSGASVGFCFVIVGLSLAFGRQGMFGIYMCPTVLIAMVNDTAEFG